MTFQPGTHDATWQLHMLADLIGSSECLLGRVSDQPVLIICFLHTLQSLIYMTFHPAWPKSKAMAEMVTPICTSYHDVTIYRPPASLVR
eukprot:1158386-Pelagomonas_calceolata.AAC.2